MSEEHSTGEGASMGEGASGGGRPSSSDLREDLERLIRGDLQGPAGGPEEEVRESRVSDRYLVGMLAPRRHRVDAGTNEGLAQSGGNAGEDGATERAATAAESMFPSSFGLTFAVAPGVERLRVHASWGRYERIEGSPIEDDDNRPNRVWKRRPCAGAVEIQLTSTISCDPPCPVSDHPEVLVEGFVRTRGTDRLVSLFLVNKQPEPPQLKDSAWLFQAELSVEGSDGSTPFMRRVADAASLADADLQREAAELRMMYRRRAEFAVGHGVSVHAEPSPADPLRAIRLHTTAMPRYDVSRQTPPDASDEGFEKLAGLVCDMQDLGATQRGGFGEKLAPLADAYEDWIRREELKRENRSEGLDSHRQAADRAIAKCRRALERIRAGIALLDDPNCPEAARAFSFANQAMALQRTRSVYAERRRRGLGADLGAIEADARTHTWFPFQLAFLLLNLPSMTDPLHPDRSHETGALADLLWFPTGGGKTEAYLGLAAYALALRRLQGSIDGRDAEAGVAVLMRYTLRLLTLQQFQRASALLCACESIRRDDLKTWGETPFRIGLWVGQKATPNWTDQAAEWIRSHRDGGRRPSNLSGVGSPAQLPHCPWCGEKIDPGRDIDVETFAKGRARTLIYCGDGLGTCLFSKKRSPGEGLPVVVVDEEIYRLLPSVVIATVDKFAQMPWDGRAQMLFGRVAGRCPRHGFRSPEVEDSDSHPGKNGFPAVKTEPCGPLRPPDLIIQDELHLISGPLGSLVGIYETVVDALCSWSVDGRRVRPKLVASTATIRNAMAQVNSIFLRRVEIFPPPGTSVEDNFFSIQRTPSDRHPGRRYVGICAPGKRLKAALIRTYVAALGASQKLWDAHENPTDPWMTLVGYFNSLRELGGMRRLVDDDVRTRLRRICQWGLGDRHPPFVEELTSRKSSSDIPAVLDLLENPFDAEDQRLRAKKERPKGHRPLDVLLATNMVSVGVDVQRLGLMVVAGQPKTTAEYIQATSRVGRRHPGLVLTVYNWARPRDLSHWERFEHYHATFYERVEALSVTPFAARAIDRALTALFVALVRLEGGRFNSNASAGQIERSHAFVREALETVARRAGLVCGDTELTERVGDMLQERLDEWLQKAQRVPHLGYKGRRDGTTVPLLESPGENDWDLFTCLTSLRDVEPTASFILVDDGTRWRDEPEEQS